MRQLRRFLRLSHGERKLLLGAAVLLVRSRLLLAFLPVPVIRRLARDGSPQAVSPSPAQIAWAVEAVGSRLLGPGSCLPRALAAEALLRRHGYPADLCVGVEKRGDRLEAHAWVTSAGTVLVGGGEAGAFQPLEPVGPGSA
jgi:hypothetical protein